ncbi:hypothetical protein ACEQPO_15025 [Bacillus sp. SL00103]
MLQANTGTMGLILLGLSVGSIVGLVLSNVFVRKKADEWRLSLVLFDVSGVHHTCCWFDPLFYLCRHSRAISFGAGSGMCNVAMNLEGTEIEYRIKKTILPILHASFSIGTLIGAGAGILFIHLGISVLNHLLVIALLFFFSIFICTRFIPHGTGMDQHEKHPARYIR